MCLAYLLPAAAAGIPLCGMETADFQYIVSMFLCSFIMTLAFTSLYTLVGMLCQNKAVTAVVTILSVCLLFVASIYISARLNEPETYQEVTALAGDGSVTSTRDVPNPGYLRGTQRQIYEFLDEFLPTGAVCHPHPRRPGITIPSHVRLFRGDHSRSDRDRDLPVPQKRYKVAAAIFHSGCRIRT